MPPPHAHPMPILTTPPPSPTPPALFLLLPPILMAWHRPIDITLTRPHTSPAQSTPHAHPTGLRLSSTPSLPHPPNPGAPIIMHCQGMTPIPIGITTHAPGLPALDFDTHHNCPPQNTPAPPLSPASAHQAHPTNQNQHAPFALAAIPTRSMSATTLPSGMDPPCTQDIQPKVASSTAKATPFAATGRS
ncbi:hypothetical protein BKA82DRAFT_4362229 [Pisolithus tinctorius]|nr:hypothetical protein BKA82DRAFT_4362229 [Pisolithus tinctorius]